MHRWCVVEIMKACVEKHHRTGATRGNRPLQRPHNTKRTQIHNPDLQVPLSEILDERVHVQNSLSAPQILVPQERQFFIHSR